jgi:hypothetical protein
MMRLCILFHGARWHRECQLADRHRLCFFGMAIYVEIGPQTTASEAAFSDTLCVDSRTAAVRNRIHRGCLYRLLGPRRNRSNAGLPRPSR